MSDDKCSILVLSCDKNADLLGLFGRNFSNYWNECPYQVYIGLEQASLALNEEWVTLYSGCSPWAQRVKSYLKQIPTDLVLIMLDDFLIEANVQQEKVTAYIEKMVLDENLINITLENIPSDDNLNLNELHLMQRGNLSNYLVNMQVGIWKKAYLYQLMKDSENPWQTEIYGSIRARQLKDKKFYCLDSDENMPIANGRGWLIVRGCWNQNEIERLGLNNDPIVSNGIREVKCFDRNAILVPRYKRIPEIIGARTRKLLSRFNIYF